ncbi:MAG: DegT/DnrJ/EryC1/StrS aminotransferase family protein [Spirochaetia bacterium]|nr:DegT/DnrJ/EryC1/StrS aminotransferase family protein [Spirochaetia bacterium]
MQENINTIENKLKVDPSVFKQEIVFNKPTLSKKELKSVLECMIQDEISFGNVVLSFEKELASAFEFQKALSTISLSSAYHLALMALDIKEDDEIILSANAPVAALDAIAYLKAKPVLTDIASNSFNPSSELFIEKITPKTRGIILFHAYGSYQNYEILREFLRNNENSQEIKVIEDISYIAGSEENTGFLGNSADIAILGLHEDMIMTIGKGAAIFTNSKNIYSIVKDLRMHGVKKVYKVRYDYTIPDYQAAMGIEQLGQLTNIINRRRKLGQIYKEAISQSKMLTWFEYPEIDTYGAFPVVCDKNVDAAKSFFQSRKIDCRKTMTYGPLSALIGEPATEFPNVEKLYQRGLLLPLYPSLTKINIERVITAIRSYH